MKTTKSKGFVFDSAEAVLGIVVPGAAEYTKQLDKLTDWVKRPQIGAKGLIYCKMNEDGTTKSSVASSSTMRLERHGLKKLVLKKAILY